MAFDRLILKNPNTGEMKKAPVGYSWTTLFFGFFPALFRADWKWAIIIFLVNLVTWGFAAIVFSFIYNKLHIKELIFSKGFKVTGSEKGNIQYVANQLGLELPMLEG